MRGKYIGQSDFICTYEFVCILIKGLFIAKRVQVDIFVREVSTFCKLNIIQYISREYIQLSTKNISENVFIQASKYYTQIVPQNDVYDVY